ncbi:hypothetical protein B0O99DRAFT_354890 [Bisporella sp. PMI_857]|nr:hypothetical protein B0O99DRAFT_354890 [Bisporella sp. PMI_857]
MNLLSLKLCAVERSRGIKELNGAYRYFGTLQQAPVPTSYFVFPIVSHCTRSTMAVQAAKPSNLPNTAEAPTDVSARQNSELPIVVFKHGKQYLHVLSVLQDDIGPSIMSKLKTCIGRTVDTLVGTTEMRLYAEISGSNIVERRFMALHPRRG